MPNPANVIHRQFNASPDVPERDVLNFLIQRVLIECDGSYHGSEMLVTMIKQRILQMSGSVPTCDSPRVVPIVLLRHDQGYLQSLIDWTELHFSVIGHEAAIKATAQLREISRDLAIGKLSNERAIPTVATCLSEVRRKMQMRFVFLLFDLASDTWSETKATLGTIFAIIKGSGWLKTFGVAYTLQQIPSFDLDQMVRDLAIDFSLCNRNL